MALFAILVVRVMTNCADMIDNCTMYHALRALICIKLASSSIYYSISSCGKLLNYSDIGVFLLTLKNCMLQ